MQRCLRSNAWWSFGRPIDVGGRHGRPALHQTAFGWKLFPRSIVIMTLDLMSTVNKTWRSNRKSSGRLCDESSTLMYVDRQSHGVKPYAFERRRDDFSLLNGVRYKVVRKTDSLSGRKVDLANDVKTLGLWNWKVDCYLTNMYYRPIELLHRVPRSSLRLLRVQPVHMWGGMGVCIRADQRVQVIPVLVSSVCQHCIFETWRIESTMWIGK